MIACWKIIFERIERILTCLNSNILQLGILVSSNIDSGPPNFLFMQEIFTLLDLII